MVFFIVIVGFVLFALIVSVSSFVAHRVAFVLILSGRQFVGDFSQRLAVVVIEIFDVAERLSYQRRNFLFLGRLFIGVAPIGLPKLQIV